MNLDLAIKKAEKAALLWLFQCHKNAEEKGFAHSRMNFLPEFCAWRKPYPETTGYIIENFLSFNKTVLPNSERIALRSADWLISIQSEEGFFYSGLNNKRPSFFNTAQIIFGLNQAYVYTGHHKYLSAINKAKYWLLSCLKEDGLCNSGLYMESFYATYYTRAIWPLLLVCDEDEKQKPIKSLYLLWNNKLENDCFQNLGFGPGQNFLSHTLLYALEGFWESSLLIKDELITNKIFNIVEMLSSKILSEKSLFGMYNQNWKAVAKMKCLTGQAQMVSLLFKLLKHQDHETLKDAAFFLLEEMLNWQRISDRPSIHGSFPASLPVWSHYFPFQSVNWTNKFFLDAVYHYHKVNK